MKISRYCGTCQNLAADLSSIKPNTAIPNKCNKKSPNFKNFNEQENCSYWKLAQQYKYLEKAG